MKLKDSGLKPGRLYGLPKVHKTRTNKPFRPILSTMGTCNYDLSKFSDSVLSGDCSSEYTIKDSFFLRRLLPILGMITTTWLVLMLLLCLVIFRSMRLLRLF